MFTQTQVTLLAAAAQASNGVAARGRKKAARELLEAGLLRSENERLHITDAGRHWLAQHAPGAAIPLDMEDAIENAPDEATVDLSTPQGAAEGVRQIIAQVIGMGLCAHDGLFLLTLAGKTVAGMLNETGDSTASIAIMAALFAPNTWKPHSRPTGEKSDEGADKQNVFKNAPWTKPN